MSSMYETDDVVDGEIVAAEPAVQTGAIQIRGTYSTAMRVDHKRNIHEVAKRLETEAALMGESAFYGWGAGKDRVEGPSQELALAAARNWGNCAIEVGPIQETSDAWVITSYFVDLETGFTMGRPFRMSKGWKVFGKLDEERKNDVRFQIGATKSARNVVLKGVPGWMIDRALEAAKSGVRAKIEKYIASKGIAAAQDLALAALKKLGVSSEAVFAKFSIAAAAGLDIEKLVILQGDIKAIQNGEARAEEIFPAASGAVFSEPKEKSPEPVAETSGQPDATTEQYGESPEARRVCEPHGAFIGPFCPSCAAEPAKGKKR